MIKNKTTQALLTAMFMMSVIPVTHAKEPEFKSELFKKGTLVYSDDFDGAYSKERWGGLLGISFWREGRGNTGLAEYMGEKGGCGGKRG